MRSVRRRGHTRPAGEHQAQGLREFVAVEPEQHGLALGEPVVERPLAWAYHSALASQDQPHLIDFDGSAAHVRNPHTGFHSCAVGVDSQSVLGFHLDERQAKQ